MQGRAILLSQEEAGTVLIASRSEEPEYARLVQAVTETRPDLSVVHLSGEVRRCAHVTLQSARKVGIHTIFSIQKKSGKLGVSLRLDEGMKCLSVSNGKPREHHIGRLWGFREKLRPHLS
jgi:hypothetical protein